MKYTQYICTSGHTFLYPGESPQAMCCPVITCIGSVVASSFVVSVNLNAVKHGTDSSYVHGCRCDDCRTAHTLAEAGRRQAARDRESVRQSYRN